MTYSHTHLVLVAACILLATLLTTNAATAQTTVLDVKDQDDNPLAQINDQGDLTAHGWIEALLGFKFPDGTMQTTAATGGGSSLWSTSGSALFYNSGKVGIGVDAPAAALHVAGNDGFVATGTFDSGSLPVSGAGTRLLWYPKKAAFRAGFVHGNQWDESNIGDYSVAMGEGTTASGAYSVAMGFATTASGLNSTAMGSGTASGRNSTAMGEQTKASGSVSTAMGERTTASGKISTAMGNGSTASGFVSTAMGDRTTASGLNSTAMGERTTASGKISTAMGHGTTASGFVSTAMGDRTTASGDHSTTMGDGTAASGIASTAMGRNTTASGIASTAMGYFTTAATPYSLSVGQYNDSNRSDDGTAFVVGNGTSTTNRSDALTLLKNGNLTIAGTLTQSSDRRLKTDIHPLTDALAGIKQLQPVHYRFRAGTNRPQEQQIGLIAQEVEAVFPELVRTGTDGYMSVSYTNLSAVLVQALNEQQAEIETLQDRLARLEAALLSADTTSTNR